AVYKDGSSDTANVVFKPAAKKTAEQFEPKYGVPGAGAVTSGEPTFHAEGNEAEGKQKPAGVRFGKGDNAPAGVTVDSESGVVTLDNPVAERTTVPVKVTYEDGSVDEVSVVFSPADAKTADTVEPKYDAPAEGATESGAPKFHEQGKPENGVDAPDGVRFELGDDAPAGAKVNPDTGVVSFDKPVDKETTVPVKAVYKDGSSDTANVVFKPAAKKTAEQFEPEWNDTNLPDDGSRVNVPNTGDEIPHDTDVDLLVGYGEHNKGEQDWTVRLEEDGSITVIPGGDAAPEDSIEVHVELTYADGSTETKTFIVKVPLTFEGFFPENLGEPDYPNSEGSDRPNTPNTTHGEFGPITGEDSGDITAGDVFDQADRFDPEWNDTDTPEDGSAVTVNNTGDDLPHGATVELGWGHGLHNKGTQDWDVELEENGDITVTPGADAEHGDSVLVQAVITYADGSTETKEFIVQVPVSGEEYVPGNFGEYGPMLQSEETELTAEEAFGQAEMIEPNWADTSTPEDGSPVTVKNTGDALPHGTKVDLGWGHGTHNKGTQDWDVDLEENGDITVKPGADAKPGDSIVVEVSITYPDGTKETKSFVTQVPVTGEEFVPGNFGELPVLTGDDNDDLTAGDVFTEAPTVNPVNPGDNTITGTGKPGATITVTGPNGFSTTTKVNENGKWSIDVPGGATPEAQYIVSQKDGDKNESDQVLVTVGGDSEIVPAPGSSELPGSSLGSSNFDIPRHLQCAVFAGGVTAIPLILLSPLHNMYELVMNPHLAGLREQFNREIHAIDQQVRRSVGPEGRAALDVLDHINGRLHQFNQQLGQFAHENRHIGLAAAAIAVAGLSYQHCMNTQANQSSSATGSSVDLSSSSSEQQAESRGIVGWFQGLFNRK
ncbi:Rib/alpha-like domain-containing protein, partial [Corynebacterium pseudodiphtheriticum]|uniref:Rib/alpha-like domain-containing protein n=1 Tax=Corynebacterium pseudodiphtheriticum TaxID=37637 RepID=UPI002542C532